ncbi:hypothetical protein C8Q73DRAFT_718749 [Cubamyces lactineus]|nr:hypothetical protein C8Q73DRAFT_718749 [Cubamyces lactineus]
MAFAGSPLPAFLCTPLSPAPPSVSPPPLSPSSLSFVLLSPPRFRRLPCSAAHASPRIIPFVTLSLLRPQLCASSLTFLLSIAAPSPVSLRLLPLVPLVSFRPCLVPDATASPTRLISAVSTRRVQSFGHSALRREPAFALRARVPSSIRFYPERSFSHRTHVLDRSTVSIIQGPILRSSPSRPPILHRQGPACQCSSPRVLYEHRPSPSGRYLFPLLVPAPPSVPPRLRPPRPTRARERSRPEQCAAKVLDLHTPGASVRLTAGRGLHPGAYFRTRVLLYRPPCRMHLTKTTGRRNR